MHTLQIRAHLRWHVRLGRRPRALSSRFTTLRTLVVMPVVHSLLELRRHSRVLRQYDLASQRQCCSMPTFSGLTVGWRNNGVREYSAGNAFDDWEPKFFSFPGDQRRIPKVWEEWRLLRSCLN